MIKKGQTANKLKSWFEVGFNCPEGTGFDEWTGRSTWNGIISTATLEDAKAEVDGIEKLYGERPVIKKVRKEGKGYIFPKEYRV